MLKLFTLLKKNPNTQAEEKAKKSKQNKAYYSKMSNSTFSEFKPKNKETTLQNKLEAQKTRGIAAW